MIQCSELKKNFGDHEVLKGVSFEIPNGSIFGLLGPSGAGKTTLLRLIMGLEKPDSGSVEGIDEERFACVFQENRLIESCNAAENVELVLDHKVPAEAVIEELKSVGIGTENEEELLKPISQFSGGMKRRVAIVRALIAQADTVILDEPCKGLDEDLKKEVIGYVDDKIGISRLILVTHDAEEAKQLCDRIIKIPG